jgi:phosphoserine / homoserine phosphotransferase
MTIVKSSTTLEKSRSSARRPPQTRYDDNGFPTTSRSFIATSMVHMDDCPNVKQTLVTLDMEGVLTPEIWIAVAEKTGIPELRRTTRDEPNYDVLMRGRLDILDQHGLKLSDIQEVIGTLHPLPGAKEFLDELRTLTQVVILSDTFEQFAEPLVRKLNWPTLLCHRLIVEHDRITDYQLRIREQKREAVAAFKHMNYFVISAGDSYNDTSMLCEADVGFLIHAPDNVKAEFPQFKAVESQAELLREILSVMERQG